MLFHDNSYSNWMPGKNESTKPWGAGRTKGQEPGNSCSNHQSKITHQKSSVSGRLRGEVLLSGDLVIRCHSMDHDHRQRILDQFTRQAEPFASAQAIRSPEALDWIVQFAETGPDDTVLDVACGPGLLACAFARVARHAVGIDITPAMLEQARKTQQEQGLQNVSWQSGDVLALPYPEHHFSIVVSRFVFHH